MGKLYDGNPCPRETIEGSNWCIFHYPEKKGELKTKFMKSLDDEINFQKSEHPEYIDFTEFHFPFEFEYYDQEYNSFFAYKAVFYQEVTFRNITFNGIVDFRYAKFMKPVVIIDSTFKENVYFIFSEFRERLGITNLLLYSLMDFFNAVFYNRFCINMLNWIIPPHIQKDDEKKYKIRVGGSIRIGNPIYRENGRLEISEKIGEVTSSYVAGILFFRSNLTNIEFIDESWPILPGGRKITVDEIIMRLPFEQQIKEIRFSPSVDEVVQVYRRLRENYEKAKRYYEAGDFFIGEMELIRNYKTKQVQLIGQPDMIKTFIIEKRGLFDSLKILLSLYYYLGCYGESLYRPIFWAVILIVSFTYIRLFNLPPSEIVQMTYFEMFQESFFTFFQLRSETSIDLFERILSAPLIGMILISIKRKLERR